MRRAYSTLRLVLFAAASLLWAGPAAAQGPQPLIVTRSSDFVITGSIGAGYDDNVVAGFDRGVDDPRFQTSGSGFDSDLNAAFSVRRTRGDFGGSVVSSFRVYRTPDSGPRRVSTSPPGSPRASRRNCG
jgi:hypothetical protein